MQLPGRTTFDTKFDLTADPAAFLDRALHMWTPLTLGAPQNQAYGYLFPQGPFFLGADLLHVPDWLTQRLWSALLLIAAYEGVRRVSRALGIPWGAAVLAGLCYALSPRLLGAVGVLSGEVLPTAVLPWVVLPLVLTLTRRLSARRGGLLSGVAVLFMSGVNATGTLAALPLAFLLAASRLRQRGGAALLGWWSLGTALACAWWIGPLLLLGRFSPPFLDYIETAAATTNPTGWANSLRGAEHWVAYHTVAGQGWWPGAHTLVTSAPLAVSAMGVTAFGLVGLLHARMPLRLPLALALVVGLVCLTAGNPSLAGSLVDDPVRALLDGPLAPLRNVHKVDPLVRLPLALGVGHASVLLAGWVGRRMERRGWERHRAVGRRVVGGVLATVLLVGAAPLFTNGLRMPGWTDVPEAWSQTAAYLDDQPGNRALVVPGAGFGVQTWGWTVDEPIQGLADAGWVTRSQSVMAPGQTVRVLDAIERRLASGQGGAGLAGYFARAGITHVVLRRDLDQQATRTADADRAERALSGSPGLRRVAGFGTTGFASQDLITVYAVGGVLPRATLVDLDDVVRLEGGPEDVLAAVDAGLLAPSQAVAVQGTDEPADVVTDGYRRVERQFGRINDSVSEVMTGSATPRQGRPTDDYPGATTVAPAEAEFLAVDDVTASSSEGYADNFAPVRPGRGPAAAFDGRPETAWRSGAYEPPVGQWLDVDLTRAVTRGALHVSFLGGGGNATVRDVEVAFDGVVEEHAVPDDGHLVVALPSTPVARVRVTVTAVAPGPGQTAPVGISEIQLPGTSPGRTLDVPRAVGADTTVLLGAETPRRACVDIGYGPHCDVPAPAEEWNGLDRRITTVEDGTWELSGTVVAQSTPAAAALLGPLGGSAVVTAGSVFGDDPSVSGAFAFDGRAETPWLADPEDDEATLAFSWTGERTVSRIAVDAPAVPAADPVRARIEASGGVRDVDLNGFGYFEPLTARDGLSITFYRADLGAREPIGVAELRIEGLDGLQHQPWQDAPTGAVCGLGPEVRIDGTVHSTEVNGTVGDLLDGSPMTWRVCDGPVALPTGAHRVLAEPTPQFRPLSLTWAPTTRPSPTAARSDQAPDEAAGVDVVSWSDARRVLSVSTGPEAVLRITENVNAGWRATLDGRPLESVVVDGWQQGYLVPAGSSGTVEVVFAADRWYRAWLLVGLALAGALVVLAATGPRRSSDPDGHRVLPAAPTRALPVGLAVLLGAVGVVVAGIPLVVGWTAGLVPPVRRHATAAGVVALVGSGVLVATSSGLAAGVPGPWADTAAALGLGLLLSGLVPVRGLRLRGLRLREPGARAADAS
ncbi:alpha-(1-_3)-arabinofuranosyltransferase domain-containing protein [Blastococcus haudaquaticus]|uniref:alpha-(1->3)-arabinofuranosyltransferase domain-containing protein n=1 Tax=Blastococcus haudaquaticus TaxID=1938745 RepID=UPI002714A376|nr:alpha-(1->3)-arabinofuranosyltransferase family protein [Blastococcus haudaquaticus]